MQTLSLPKKKIITFLAITLALSSIFYYLIISAGSLEIYGGLYVLGLMWSPGIAGLVTQAIYEHSLRGLGWRLGKAKYLLWALVIPLIYCLIVYGITWITGLGGFPDPDLMQAIETRWSGTTTSPALQIILTVALSALLTIPVGLISAMGEEIGWRGLLVPELAKITSFSNASLISGLIWALWHFPLLFFADYNLPGAPLWYAALMFTILVIGISYAFAYLRLKSGSVWPAGLMHSSHNVFVQNIFTPLTVQTALTPYIIDEFGIGLALAGIGVAVIFWQLSKKLPAADSKQPGR